MRTSILYISLAFYFIAVLSCTKEDSNTESPDNNTQINFEKASLIWPTDGAHGINHLGKNPKFNPAANTLSDEFYYYGYIGLAEDTADWFGTTLRFLDDSGQQSEINYDYWPNLEYNKTYYWQIEVFNDLTGIKVKSDLWSFTTDNGSFLNPELEYGEFTDARDGNVYKTIKIGEQEWMAQNLAYLPEITPISNFSETQASYGIWQYYGEDVEESKSFIISEYQQCDWDGDGIGDGDLDRLSYQTFGVIYNIIAAQQACPEGWRLPNKEDWNTLKQAQANLCSKKGWSVSNVEQTNITGFSAIMGTRVTASGFSTDGVASWWSSSVVPNDYGTSYYYYATQCTNWEGDLNVDYQFYRSDGLSIRCIKE